MVRRPGTAPGTTLRDFRREHGSRPWPATWLAALAGVLVVGAVVAFVGSQPVVGTVLLVLATAALLLRVRLAAVPGSVPVAHRHWLRDALPANEPGVEAVLMGSVEPQLRRPGVLVVRAGGHPAAVTVEHRSLDSGPVVLGPASGPAADRMLAVVGAADELRAAGTAVPDDLSADGAADDVLAAADVLRAKRRPPEPPRPAPADLPHGSLADALRMADVLQARYSPDPEPFPEHERQLRDLPPRDLHAGETRLFSTAQLQDPDGWHAEAFEGRVLSADRGGIRWEARAEVVGALVEVLGPTLGRDGDALVVRVGGQVLERALPRDGWFPVPTLPGDPWHVLPRGERASSVHHGSLESALADAQQALDRQAAASVAAMTGPPVPPSRRAFLVTCDWMGLVSVDGRRRASHAVEGVPVGLEDDPAGGRPSLVWWTTEQGVLGIVESIHLAWLKARTPSSSAHGGRSPGAEWSADRAVVTIEHGPEPVAGREAARTTLRADEEGRFWIPPLGAPWELLGPLEYPTVSHGMHPHSADLFDAWALHRSDLAGWARFRRP